MRLSPIHLLQVSVLEKRKKIRQEILSDFIPKTRVVKDFALNPKGYSMARLVLV
jgi:hypothetical protein